MYRKLFFFTLSFSLPFFAMQQNESNEQLKTPLMKAVTAAKVKRVQRILQSIPNVDAQDTHGSTALLEAAKNIMMGIKIKESTRILTLLLLAGANPNIADITRTTPLIYLTQNIYPEVVEMPIKYLLAAHADAAARDALNKTALDYLKTNASNRSFTLESQNRAQKFGRLCMLLEEYVHKKAKK